MTDEGKGRKLNWRQACKILGCGKRHFYALIKNGSLPAWKIKDAKRGLWVWENDVKSLIKQIAND